MSKGKDKIKEFIEEWLPRVNDKEKDTDWVEFFERAERKLGEEEYEALKDELHSLGYEFPEGYLLTLSSMLKSAEENKEWADLGFTLGSNYSALKLCDPTGEGLELVRSLWAEKNGVTLIALKLDEIYIDDTYAPTPGGVLHRCIEKEPETLARRIVYTLFKQRKDKRIVLWLDGYNECHDALKTAINEVINRHTVTDLDTGEAIFLGELLFTVFHEIDSQE